MKRQGLLVTIEELKAWVATLEEECSPKGTVFQINIINRAGQSDTWEIEK